MRLSSLARKEIINLYDGDRIGLIGESDLLVDEETGTIAEIEVPSRPGMLRAHRGMSIPWSAVRRVGPEVLIVDLEPLDTGGRRRRSHI